MSRNNGIMSLLAIAVATFLSACSGQETVQEVVLQNELMTSGNEVNYTTVSVEKGTYQTVMTSGQIVVTYPVTAELSLDKSNASYKEVLVKKNQEVKEGDVLMTFDITGSRTELETLKLQLQRAQEDFAAGNAEKLAAIEKAKENAEELLDYELEIANLKIEKQQMQYEQYCYQSQLRIADLQERIREMEEDMQENILVAPFDGVIEEIVSYTIGDKVISGQVLIKMYSTDKLLLGTNKVPAGMRYDMDVTVEVSKRKESKFYSGKIIALPDILPSSVSQNIMAIELDDGVTPDMLEGTITIDAMTEEVKDVLVVDKKAIEQESGVYYVNILEDGMVKKRYIDKYSNSRADRVWILDGLSEGQTLIID